MKLYLAGHTGLVGSALMRRLAARRDIELLTATRAELDLLDSQAVRRWLAHRRPEAAIVAAGLTGGILANTTRPADFIYQNLMIEANVIRGAWEAGATRLLNFGSSCMYPKQAPQPMRVGSLMTGPMEPTSAPYAFAKWAGLSLCEAYSRQHGVRFVTVIPATVYGPGDSFDQDEAHVLSALIRKCHEAKTQRQPALTLWGTGSPRRELIYADDLAEACELVLERYEGPAPLNIGSGESRTIDEMARLVAAAVGYAGSIRWDRSRPDGAPEKRLESSAVHALGWMPRTPLREGIARTYAWFLTQAAQASEVVACTSS